MFCKNCGTKLEENATSCPTCGLECPPKAKEQPTPYLAPPKPETQGRSWQFYISLGVSVLVIIIFFTKWITIAAMSMLGIGGSSGGLSVYGSLRSLLKLTDYLDGLPSSGGIWFMVILLFLLFLIPVLHGVYCYRLLKVETEGTKKIGSVVSAFAFFLTLIFVVSVLVINHSISSDLGGGYFGRSIDIFGLNATPFIIILLSALNNRIISKIRFSSSQVKALDDSAICAER